MCRIFGYFGDPRSLSDLLFAPPHGLREQARRPRELPPGVVGADGFGISWYTPAAREPARYRSVLPMWSDEDLPHTSMHLRSGCVVASIRSATQGMPVTLSNSPPYVRGDLSLVHNGMLESFAEQWMMPIRRALPSAIQTSIVGNTDSEHLLALLARELLDQPPTPDGLARATEKVLDRCRTWSDELECKASLNLLVSNGEALIVTRAAFGGAEPPSLYLWRSEVESSCGVLVASEPTFADERWVAIRPGALLIVENDREVREREVRP